MKIALAFLGLILLLLIAGAGRSESEFPIPPKSLPPDLHNPKVESSLEELALDMGAQGLPDGGVRAVLRFTGKVTTGDLASLRQLGVATEAHSGNLVRARIPQDRLDEVAELPRLLFIRRPYRPVGLTEALGPIGAGLFHAHGFRGQGVRVAVIDVGFGGLSWAVREGALPRGSIADATDYTGEGLEEGTNHGTAVAELVHDAAPKALLYLKKVGDEVDLANAVDDSLRQGIQIIVHSVGWFNTNFTDGTGIVDELADRAHRGGILWVNAAGNHARQHWTGPLRDGDGDGWAEFQGFEESLTIQASFGEVQLFLTWNDWPRTCQDYDLFLYDSRGALVASSQNYQSCIEPPTEELKFLVLQPGAYYARVLARNRLNPVALKIFSANAQLEPAIPQGSLPAPADARGVLSVGAVPIGLWERGPQERFSSQGPTHDGRIKPELMGPDNIRTFTEIGFLHRFRGTSAAAPHVAGAAALLLSQHPDWTVDQVWTELERSAIDMGRAGRDNVYGWGRLNLSLGRPSAEREIKTPIRPGNQAIRGGAFSVTVRAKMPPSRFGGLVFKERLPPGFGLIPLENDGAEFDPEKLEWSWPIVEPGTVKQVSYRVIVPLAQALGDYRLEGVINDRTVGGAAEFEVIAPLGVAEAVAHWDPRERVIDLELDGRIDKDQLEQAIRWWLADAEVPATGGQPISSRGLEKLIAHQLSGTPVDQLLPALPATGLARASRKIITESPNGSFLVTVEIEAQARIYGLRLAERWPRGVEVEPVEGQGAIFKELTTEWFWAKPIAPGETNHVKYRVTCTPAHVHTCTLINLTGIISSALPRFSLAVGGEGRAELATPGLELTAVKALSMGNGIQFIAEGRGIEEVRAQVFDLAGQEVYDSGWMENGILWMTGEGEVLANGVYLYLLTVRGAEGRQLQRLGKVAILR